VTHNRWRRALRFLRRASFAVCVTAILSAACAFPFAGRFLVVEDPIRPADAIIVLGGIRGGRWLEALDLFEEKVAPRIVLSSDRSEGAEFESLKRGVQIPRTADHVRDAMIRLGVPEDAVEVFRYHVDNTAQEADTARVLARERGWNHLLIITSKYHTRRARFAFERSFRASGVQISVRSTRYDPSAPRTWWMHRYDARWVFMELPKLLIYRMGLEG
jgi:uncharacterized SAM-binding protein YcdF (DUF218 family)